MKFPDIDFPDFPQLVYFDSWEADRYTRVLYYACLLLVWYLSVMLTVWATLHYSLWGLVAGGLLSLFLIFTGVLCVRLVLEGCLSLSVIRDAVAQVTMYQDEFAEGEEEEGELAEEGESEEEEESVDSQA